MSATPRPSPAPGREGRGWPPASLSPFRATLLPLTAAPTLSTRLYKLSRDSPPPHTATLGFYPAILPSLRSRERFHGDIRGLRDILPRYPGIERGESRREKEEKNFQRNSSLPPSILRSFAQLSHSCKFIFHV